MAVRLVLDAMIRRADFWQKESTTSTDNSASAKAASSITLENLGSESNFLLSLRKPDFQRETNQWSVTQAHAFLQSFVDGDLVPSVILWQSDEGFIFVIDGAHRLSTLRAWIEDDYGDRGESFAFFKGEISEEQKKAAEKMRKTVEKGVGNYKSLHDKLKARRTNPNVEYDATTNKRLKHLGSRQLELQWVTGDADVAESSFFKINTQGTPLDKTEESLLRNRKCAPAIAARSIIRAATGHEYWSKFHEEIRKKIERLASDANKLLFQPEIKSPVIRTLELPLGGSASTLDALSLLMKLLSITDGTQTNRRPKLGDTGDDDDGTMTVATLKNTLKILERISGPDAGSLGLHPAVYFYSDRGKYLPDLFLGMVYLIKGQILNSNSKFFKEFTYSRAKIEEFLISNKQLLTQILQQIRSASRIERAADIFDYLIKNADEATIDGVANAARLRGQLVDLRERVESKKFSDASKSAIMLRQSLKDAMKCPICQGRLDASKSASYDHVMRKEDGGNGDDSNGQMTHPYCNTGIKN